MDRTTPESLGELLQIFLNIANEAGFDANDVRNFLITGTIGFIAREYVNSPDSLDEIFYMIRFEVLNTAQLIRDIESKDE